MNPVELITNDHREVEALFAEYESLGATAYAAKRALADQIIRALELHTEMEETIAYPAFREALKAEEDKMVEEAFAEHEVVKHLIEEIRSLSPEDPQFDAKVTVLRENVQHHVKEEETELLPEAEKELSEEELQRIGEELQDFKDSNLTVAEAVEIE